MVPGHGHVGDAGEFGRRLAAGEPFEDPRITKDWMRAAHEEHLAYVRG